MPLALCENVFAISLLLIYVCYYIRKCKMSETKKIVLSLSHNGLSCIGLQRWNTNHSTPVIIILKKEQIVIALHICIM